jgi:class 3 adenylate cyclase
MPRSYTLLMAPCPRCGEENLTQARYCSACGASLDVLEPTGGVRKTVTVVFTDIAGSTALGERLDPESVRGMMARYFEEARVVFERHGGTVEKFIGDAVMAAFGIPTLHEDDALRALRAAVELRDRLAVMNDDVQRELEVGLEVRIGVNSGEVVAGDSSQGQAFATGDAVNVAARLEQAAEPGEILVGSATRGLVGGAVRFEPVEPLALKGKEAPVLAWRLLEVLDDVPAFLRRLDAPFVGRGGELAQLEAAFEQAVESGACRLVTVLGPPGVGKSRLARELVSWAGERARVVVGRCPPYGEGITYWPLSEIVRQVSGGDPAALRKLVEDEEGAELIADGVAAAVGVEEGGARAEEIFWAVSRLLETLARERPLVAVVDDIHWAEPTFLDLLEYLTSFGRASILLLCLARADLLDLRPTWAAPRENASLLALDPLSDLESDALVEGLLRGTGLADALRGRIVDTAEGNPLFVEQMLALAREADGGSEDLAVPPTIQALLAARIDRLEAGERVVVERAAVEGRLFHRGAVSTLLSESERERLPAHLMALVRKELIRPDRAEFSGEDGFRFAHSLIRDAAYESVPKGLRAELHRRFADWVEAKSPELDELVGYHLEQAVRYRSELGALRNGELDLARRACERLASAGRRAFARGDMPAAANLLDRAASLMSLDAPERPELLITLGTALGDKGDLAGAADVLGEAIERAEAVGNVGLEQHALLQRSYLQRYTHTEGGTAELLNVAKLAVPVFEELEDVAGLARAWRLVAEAHWWRCEVAPMEDALRRALEHAHQANEEQEVFLILDALGRAAVVGPTPVDEGVRRCREILEQTAGDRSLEAFTAVSLAYLEAMRGNFEEARELSRRSNEILEDLGKMVALAASQSWVAEIELLAGNPGGAESLLRSALATLESMGERGNASTVAAILAQALYLQRDDEEAERLTVISEEAAALDDLTSQILWRTTRSRILTKRGRSEEAAQLALRAIALAEQTDALNLHADALMGLADVFAAAGRADDADAAVREALKLYEAKGNIVSADRARSRLAGKAAKAGTARADRAS